MARAHSKGQRASPPNAGRKPSARAAPGRRRLRGRLLALAASSLVALLCAEGALRILGIRPERYSQVQFLVWNGTGWIDQGRTAPGLIKAPSRYQSLGVTMGEYVPGARFRMKYPTDPRGYFGADHAASFTINSLGMRGAEVPEAKPPGAFRILGVGDSFTFGEGVREEDTYLRRLEAALDRAPGAGRVQVLNAGVQGYNTRDEILTLEKRWLSLEPDLVLIGFCLNDAYSDTAFPKRGQELLASLEPAGLAKVSLLVDLAQHAWKVRSAQRRLDDYYAQHYFADADTVLDDPGEARFDWKGARAALSRAADLSRERGFGMALVIFPELRELDEDYPFARIHALVRRTCGELGIPVLDLLDVYRGLDARSLWVHPIDHHPNEIAHRMAAEAIGRFLVERSLLPPDRPSRTDGRPSSPVGR